MNIHFSAIFKNKTFGHVQKNLLCINNEKKQNVEEKKGERIEEKA